MVAARLRGRTPIAGSSKWGRFSNQRPLACGALWYIPAGSNTGRRMEILTRARRIATAAATAVVSALVPLSASMAADIPNVTGTWQVTDHCERGWCATNVYTGTWTILNQAGSNTLSGHDNAANVLDGSISGAQASWILSGPSYRFTVHATFSPSGQEFSGTWVDSRGGSGTTTGTRYVVPPTLEVAPRPKKHSMLDYFAVGFIYRGVHWDPMGGPIRVSWAGKLIRTFRPSASFEGELFQSEWPHRDSQGCSGVIAARQGGSASVVPVRAGLAGRVLFADNDSFYKTGSLVCDGEGFLLHNTRGTVIAFDGRAIQVYSAGHPRHIELTGIGRPLCVGLVPASHGHVVLSRDPSGQLRIEKHSGKCR
jgi:hypothetical protein